jgi:hypothetical protein
MNLKKMIAALLSCVLTCGAIQSVNCSSRQSSAAVEAQQTVAAGASDNPCNKQDDMEVPYDGRRWIQPVQWNCPTINPRNYDGGIMLFFDKIGLDPERTPGKVQRVYFSVHGATEPVSMMKFHIFYDTRLKIKKNEKGEVVNAGKAITEFTTGSELVEEGQIAFYAYSKTDIEMKNASLLTIDFIIPENAEPGDVYPIGIAYVDDGIVCDTFINSAQDEAGKLQMTYVFCKGIYNGYIKMMGEKKTTAPTTAATTVDPKKTRKGDVNLDTIVDVSDAVLVARFCAGDSALEMSDQGKANADVNGDNNIDLDDLTAILKTIARLI